MTVRLFRCIADETIANVVIRLPLIGLHADELTVDEFPMHGSTNLQST